MGYNPSYKWDFCRVNPLKKLGWTNPLTIRDEPPSMENCPFTDDFPTKTSIYNGFSIAMLNNQMVSWTTHPWLPVERWVCLKFSGKPTKIFEGRSLCFVLKGHFIPVGTILELSRWWFSTSMQVSWRVSVIRRTCLSSQINAAVGVAEPLWRELNASGKCSAGSSVFSKKTCNKMG